MFIYINIHPPREREREEKRVRKEGLPTCTVFFRFLTTGHLLLKGPARVKGEREKERFLQRGKDRVPWRETNASARFVTLCLDVFSTDLLEVFPCFPSDSVFFSRWWSSSCPPSQYAYLHTDKHWNASVHVKSVCLYRQVFPARWID